MADNPDIEKALAVKIRNLRIEAGMSQAALAAELGVHQTRISKTESGDRPLRVNEAAQLAKVFDMSLADFVGTDEVSAAQARRELERTIRKRIAEEIMAKLARYA